MEFVGVFHLEITVKDIITNSHENTNTHTHALTIWEKKPYASQNEDKSQR